MPAHMNRKAARRDSAEPAIVSALVKAGASVVKLSDTGVPDLLVGFENNNYLIEVKTGKAKLTPEQDEFFAGWKGYVLIARTPEAALSIIGVRPENYHLYLD